ncbi:hypothetical protein D9M72_460150 [compost metagenome]
MYGRLSVPRNTSLNCTMPELVNSSVGSFAGTRLDERTTVWPFDSKNCRNLLRMSETFMGWRTLALAWPGATNQYGICKPLIIRARQPAGHARHGAGEPAGYRPNPIDISDS